MPVISSANVACGGHAGDPGTMRRTDAAGALPRRGGRRPSRLPRPAGLRPARDADEPAGGRGPGPLPGQRAGRHRQERRRPAPARQGARRALQHGLPRRGPGRGHRPGGGGLRSRRWCCSACPTRPCSRPASTPGLPVAAEAFADRAYHADGIAGVAQPARAASSTTSTRWSPAPSRWPARARSTAIDGSRIAFEVDTLCVHGDTPGAAALAAAHPPRARRRRRHRGQPDALTRRDGGAHGTNL